MISTACILCLLCCICRSALEHETWVKLSCNAGNKRVATWPDLTYLTLRGFMLGALLLVFVWLGICNEHILRDQIKQHYINWTITSAWCSSSAFPCVLNLYKILGVWVLRTSHVHFRSMATKHSLEPHSPSTKPYPCTCAGSFSLQYNTIYKRRAIRHNLKKVCAQITGLISHYFIFCQKLWVNMTCMHIIGLNTCFSWILGDRGVVTAAGSQVF